MITKINTCKIEYQSNMKIFVYNYDNLIKIQKKIIKSIQNNKLVEELYIYIYIYIYIDTHTHTHTR